jgi:aminopeptidase-like protein
LAFVRPDSLAGSLSLVEDVIGILEANRTFRNTHPRGEPRLGKRGLYRTAGGRVERAPNELAMLWVLNLSDGRASLLDIAERSALPFVAVAEAAATLQDAGLLHELT